MNIKNSIDEISQMYPYGQFPQNHVKQSNNLDDLLNTIKINSQQTNETQKKEDHPSQNSFSSILPIITNLLSNKEKDTKNILSSILPLLIGNKGKDISQILKLIKTKNESINPKTTYQKQTLPPTTYKKIDSYEKI